MARARKAAGGAAAQGSTAQAGGSAEEATTDNGTSNGGDNTRSGEAMSSDGNKGTDTAQGAETTGTLVLRWCAISSSTDQHKGLRYGRR